MAVARLDSVKWSLQLPQWGAPTLQEPGLVTQVAFWGSEPVDSYMTHHAVSTYDSRCLLTQIRM
jgi:hypothetical protein